MFPPTQGLRLDIDAISQIFGSISIACWIVVFSPQIIENWKRSSADGLSVVFIIIWLLGDFFNIFGAVMQGVLPTMTILAVYYTLADIVLLLQCFWYKGFTLRDEVKKPGDDSAESGSLASEEAPLLSESRFQTNGASYASVVANGDGNGNGHQIRPRISDVDRRHSNHSQSSFRERFLSIDGTHLSPVTPLLDSAGQSHTIEPQRQPAQSTLKMVLFNLGTIILVMAAGVFGWWLSASASADDTPSTSPEPTPQFNLWGQIFGYICAALYLGSRIPQLLLNYRRKSTDGISMLFFLFACLGNLTYVLSIVVYKPRCKHHHCKDGEAAAIYGRYMAVNFSWLLGSFGTLLLDACVFIQYFLYKENEDDSEDEDE